MDVWEEAVATEAANGSMPSVIPSASSRAGASFDDADPEDIDGRIPKDEPDAPVLDVSADGSVTV